MVDSGTEFYTTLRAAEREVEFDEVSHYAASLAAQDFAFGLRGISEVQTETLVDPNVVIPMTTFSYHEYPILKEHLVSPPVSNKQLTKTSNIEVSKPCCIKFKILPEPSLVERNCINILPKRSMPFWRDISDREYLRVFALENRLAKHIASE
ncbi:hypothetical protein K7432_009675 [Basidiobolus ranarum]|uniref:Uncharacterized protein n=1 Tax=Basidiobolus ranarum TaxID=34480 RepID=A0ABR2WPX9_9FUNG